MTSREGGYLNLKVDGHYLYYGTSYVPVNWDDKLSAINSMQNLYVLQGVSYLVAEVYFVVNPNICIYGNI